MPLFDILGFSNFVETNSNQVILELYNKLLDLINKQKSSFDKSESFAGNVAPVPISNDWKSNALIADANGYINICHFSDTFIIYVNYLLNKQPFWLADQKNEPYPLLLGEPGTIQYPIMYEKHHIYLSFLQTCMDFFCQAVVAGIPLRGCISTGLAIMDPYKSIYLGSPLVEAARGETARNSLGSTNTLLSPKRCSKTCRYPRSFKCKHDTNLYDGKWNCASSANTKIRLAAMLK